jgi:hypothetical protein
LKVLFITGFAQNAAVGNGHLDCGMEILAKPFAMAALGNRVSDMLETRQQDEQSVCCRPASHGLSWSAQGPSLPA